MAWATCKSVGPSRLAGPSRSPPPFWMLGAYSSCCRRSLRPGWVCRPHGCPDPPRPRPNRARHAHPLAPQRPTLPPRRVRVRVRVRLCLRLCLYVYVFVCVCVCMCVCARACVLGRGTVSAPPWHVQLQLDGRAQRRPHSAHPQPGVLAGDHRLHQGRLPLRFCQSPSPGVYPEFVRGNLNLACNRTDQPAVGGVRRGVALPQSPQRACPVPALRQTSAAAGQAALALRRCGPGVDPAKAARCAQPALPGQAVFVSITAAGVSSQNPIQRHNRRRARGHQGLRVCVRARMRTISAQLRRLPRQTRAQGERVL